MNDIIKAFQLVEEEKYKEAYEAFSNLIGDKALEMMLDIVGLWLIFRA